jgi:two-component system, chemotaxis family, protein-glutamate methylesterase/glutaminase
MNTKAAPFRVLVVDDSASARVMLRQIIESDPALQVQALAEDAFAAARIMANTLPDVILLDLEMPKMDGVTFLRKIMAQRPLPVVICSSLNADGARRSVEAMEAGAMGVIRKPEKADREKFDEARATICDALIAAAMAGRRGGPGGQVVAKAHGGAPDAAVPLPLRSTPRLSADEILPAPSALRPPPPTQPVVCIGASTGGTEALSQILCDLPPDAPAIVVVQHMPKGFTAAFSARLNGLAQIEVLEATEGLAVKQGRCIIAAGDSHMLLRRSGTAYRVELSNGPAVSRHRPSVDVLFRSAAQAAGGNALGILLTGMGMDGAQCLGEMMRAGAHTIAQNEETCVVYGMPREAVQLGHARQVLGLPRISGAITGFARLHGSKAEVV